MSPVVPPRDPKPISDSLERHLTEVLAKIPSGKSGHATVTITNAGIEAAVGHKLGRLGKPVLSGWAGREWSATGWSAGARSAWTW